MICRHHFLAVLAVMLAPAAWAALPDPVTFGVRLEAGDVEAARRWLDEGLDPDMEADRIGSGLMIGAWEGNLGLMELFQSRGASLHKTNRYGEQALQLAAWRGHIDAVRWLLDRGAPIDREGRGWSALHYAVFAGHGEVARLLMERGADINGRAPNGASALMLAAREGREELAGLLIDKGADPSLATDRGDTALRWAMRNGNYRIAKRVSSAPEFAAAVQAAPETYPPMQKSVPAPSEISELLAELRRAEAAGAPTAELRRRLVEAIARFRKESTVVDLKTRKSRTGKIAPTLVITARRNPGGGERAELVGAAPASTGPAATLAQRAWDYDEARLDDFTQLLRELGEAERQGLPTAALRRAVKEAYERMKAAR